MGGREREREKLVNDLDALGHSLPEGWSTFACVGEWCTWI